MVNSNYFMDSESQGECGCFPSLFTYFMSMPKWKMLKTKCLEQHALFVKWDERKNYSMFHRSHYDWWAFPIDQLSSHGDKFKVGPEERDQLKEDNEFINALRGNAVLVCRSWGYDLETGKAVSVKTADQKWQQWPIRLYKLTNSLQLFQQHDLFVHAVEFGNRLIAQGHKFSYNRKRLDEYFIAKGKDIALVEKEEKPQKEKMEALQEEGEQQRHTEKVEQPKEEKPDKKQIKPAVSSICNKNEAINKHTKPLKQQSNKPVIKGTL